MIELMARKTGAFEVHYRRDYEALDSEVLSQYDAIVMNSTAHLQIPEASRKLEIRRFSMRWGIWRRMIRLG